MSRGAGSVICRAPRRGDAKLALYPGRGHVSLVASLARPLRFHAPVLADMDRFIEGLWAPAP